MMAIRLLFRRDDKLENRVAVVRQMEVAKRNYIHSNQHVKPLKLAIANAKPLDDDVVGQQDVHKVHG